MTDLSRWLDRLGLGQYAAVFAENDVDLDVLPYLTDQELKDLGGLVRVCKSINESNKSIGCGCLG